MAVTLRIPLWCCLAVSAAMLAARAAIGPFHLLVFVNSPMNAEGAFAVSMLLLLALQASRKSLAGAAGVSYPAVILLAAAGAAAWLWSCWIPFVAEDSPHVAQAAASSPGVLVNLFTHPGIDQFFRPVTRAAFFFESRFAGTNPLPWHVFSLLLHLANSALVFLLAVERGYARAAALFASLFFLLNGTRAEAVNWISAQFDLWAAFFFLLALLAFLIAVRTQGSGWRWASVAALTAALLSKESAYAFILVALPAAWIDGVRGRKLLRELWPAAAATAVVFLYRSTVIGGIGGYLTIRGDPQFYSVHPIQTAKGLFWRVPAVLTFPINWSREPEWWLTAGLILLVAALAALAGARISGRKLWFALGLWVAPLLPAFLFLLIGPDLEKSRMLYLPGVGMALLLAAAAELSDRRAAFAAMCGILVFQAASLEHNLRIRKDVALEASHVCAEIGTLAVRTPQPVHVGEMPLTIDGVYFLKHGLRACAELAAGAPLGNLYVADDSEHDPPPPLVKSGINLDWDSSRQELEQHP